MFKFDNTHIFTGYLKQKLSSVNIPTCKIYTQEFARYLAQNGKEDPRVVESIDTIVYDKEHQQTPIRINYLKNNELYNYYTDHGLDIKLGQKGTFWKHSSNIYYDSEKAIPGLTRKLCSPGRFYDTTTHEYLGEYLRFLRDYHNINLMSLYNCFNNTICNNIYLSFTIGNKTITFDSHDPNYKIYAIPVKLFADYTIALDSSSGIEIFCGLYNNYLDLSGKTDGLFAKTYQKISKTIFNQPILYNKLNIDNWPYSDTYKKLNTVPETYMLNTDTISRWTILNREQDLKMFIKIPTTCKSSITILEGDFRNFNKASYLLNAEKPWASASNSGVSSEKPLDKWTYEQNRSIINCSKTALEKTISNFNPISKLQLLEFNTGESYPFADRLVEYLSGSAITPIDEIPDNIKRAQRVMKQNQYHFKIEGLWENKIQRIIYDYIMNSGPFEVVDGKLVDKRRGYQPRLGHTNKSTVYDILGYIDRDAEKLYANWQVQDDKPVSRDTIQNIDIYNGLYDI